MQKGVDELDILLKDIERGKDLELLDKATQDSAKLPFFPIVIVVNKSDLVDEKTRQQGMKHAMDLLKKTGIEISDPSKAYDVKKNALIMLTSAKTKQGVEETFKSCVGQVMHYREIMKKKKDEFDKKKKSGSSSHSKGGLFASISNENSANEDINNLFKH